MTSACAGAAPVASETVSAEPKPSVAGTVVNGIPTKPELAFDGKNHYVQTTIADDDPAMIYDPATATDIAITLWREDELADGQKFATKFLAEEVLDSIINDNHADTGNIDKWLSAHKEKFDPAQYDGFAANLHRPYTPKDDVLLRGGYREGKYELVSGSDQTRIQSRTITPTLIRAQIKDGKPYVEYRAQVRVAYKVKLNGQDTIETVVAKVATVMSKDMQTNKWQIAGMWNEFTPNPAV